MQDQIIMLYCVCDDFLKAYGWHDDRQTDMTTAEVMTTALVGSACFHGCYESSRQFLKSHGYIPKMLSKSRFNRRLNRIPVGVWQSLFWVLSQIHQHANTEQTYAVDSFPVAVCDNFRIRRCRLYRQPSFRGYIASKRRYFYGLRVHLLVTATGQPVEVVFAPGADADITVFKRFELDLPTHATIYADKAYTDYRWEDLLAENADLSLVALRKANAKRPMPGWVRYLCQLTRQRIETTFSQITERLARSIHAVTPCGFELKVFLAILTFSILG